MKPWQTLVLSFVLTAALFIVGGSALWLLVTRPGAFFAFLLGVAVVTVFIRLWWFFYEELSS